jgi:hypothetical protein
MRKNKNTLRGAVACLGLFGLLAAPGAVLAIEPGTSTIQITGTVPPITHLPAPTALGGDNATYTAGIMTITELVDSTAHLKPASLTLKFEGVTTNYPAKFAFTSTNNGLKSGSEIIPYSAGASAPGATPHACTFGTGGPTNCVSAAAAPAITFTGIDVEVEITTDILANDNDRIVQAGTYSDTLVFKVGATL